MRNHIRVDRPWFGAPVVSQRLKAAKTLLERGRVKTERKQLHTWKHPFGGRPGRSGAGAL